MRMMSSQVLLMFSSTVGSLMMQVETPNNSQFGKHNLSILLVSIIQWKTIFFCGHLYF